MTDSVTERRGLSPARAQGTRSGKGWHGSETEKVPMALDPLSSACLLSVEKLQPRISLISEVRKCRSEEK